MPKLLTSQCAVCECERALRALNMQPVDKWIPEGLFIFASLRHLAVYPLMFKQYIWFYLLCGHIHLLCLCFLISFMGGLGVACYESNGFCWRIGHIKWIRLWEIVFEKNVKCLKIWIKSKAQKKQNKKISKSIQTKILDVSVKHLV